MESVLQTTAHLSHVDYDPSMAQQLVASIDLHGQLHITNQQGQELDVGNTINQLSAEKNLLKQLAIVWVPTQQVLMTLQQVPGKRKAHWQAAFPYALEETLTHSIDEYHLLAFNRNKQQQVAAAAVSLETMQQWQSVLKEYGLEQAILVADCFRIPFTADTDRFNTSPNSAGQAHDNNDNSVADTTNKNQESGGVIWLQSYTQNNPSANVNSTVLVRTGEYQGLAAQEDWFAVIKSQYQQALPHNAELMTQSVKPEDLLSSCQQYVSQVKKVSLSQGAFGVTSQVENSWLEWRWMGVLVLLLAVVWLSIQVIQTQQIERQALYTQQQSEKLFKTFFPETKRIVNIKSQTLTKLKQAGGQTANRQQLIPLLQAIEPLFKNNKKVTVTALTWQVDKQNALMIEVKSSQSKELEKLVSASTKLNVSLRLNLKNVTSEQAEGEIYVAAN